MTNCTPSSKVQQPYPAPPTISYPNQMSTTSSINSIELEAGRGDGLGKKGVDITSAKAMLNNSTKCPDSHLNPLILIDLGASDHCFIDCSMFTVYTPFEPLRSGNSAGKDSTFVIAGSGTVEFMTNLDGITTKLVILGALHTLHLRSSLISVLRLVTRGFVMSFEGTRAVVRSAVDALVLQGERKEGLYIIPLLQG